MMLGRISVFLICSSILAACASSVVRTGPEFDLLSEAERIARNGDMEAGIAAAKQAVEVARNQRNKFSEARANLMLGQLYYSEQTRNNILRKTEPMIDYFDAAAALFDDVDMLGYEAFSHYQKIHVLLAADKNYEACDSYETVMEILDGSEPGEWEGFAYHPYDPQKIGSPRELVHKRYSDFCFKLGKKKKES